MAAFDKRIGADWGGVLRRILARARSLGPRAVVAFDLDSTLFDNRPRQARILREFGAARNIPALAGCAANHFDSGWDLKGAMRNCGLNAGEVERLYPDLKTFWYARFFTGDYCLDDVAVRGAAEFVKTVAETGATICYVTGRHEEMRRGTLDALRRSGMAVPGSNVHLIMKPTLEMSDDEFKREAHRRLSEMGLVIAAFDNEPTHVNDYRRTFPEATIVHLATDHSGRSVELLEGVVTVPHFAFEVEADDNS